MGATDDVLALEIAYSILPQGRWMPGYSGNDIFLILDSIKLDEQSAQGWWKASATYIFNSNTGQGGSRPEAIGAATLPFIKIGFNVGNKTRTITQSIRVLGRVSATDLADRPLPDAAMGNAIGVTEDTVEGAEIAASGLGLQITAYYFPEYVTYTFLKYLADAIPSTNADEFLTFPPGSCLLLGADGQATVTDVIPITYTVDVKPNIIDQEDPPFPNLTEIGGHDLLDYRYAKELDETAKMLLQMPTYRLIHQVYRASAFANLGFPTS